MSLSDALKKLVHRIISKCKRLYIVKTNYRKGIFLLNLVPLIYYFSKERDVSYEYSLGT